MTMSYFQTVHQDKKRNLRPPLKTMLLPVHRPGELKGAEGYFFFPFF